jgi:thiol:disulfide interchange protein
MQGTIRTFLGLALLVAAGSVNDTLPDAEFFAWALGLAIPGALIAFSGVRALNRAEQQNF